MFLQNLQKTLKQNIREYGMYIALFLIMAIFAVTTKGTFVSSRNLSNLLNQTGYIAVLAVGMTLVIVIRHIDLSVGFLAGFLGAIAAIALVSWKLPVIAVIPLVLALGIVGGLITAYPVAKLGIPSSVASLAGWLIYRGLLLLVTQSTGTIIVPDKAFNAIGNGFIPDIPGLTNVLPGMHKLTTQTIPVLKSVSLTIMPGEMVAIMGASGSGKSTLMNIIGCLDKPSSGEVYINGRVGERFAVRNSGAIAVVGGGGDHCWE